MAEKGEADAAHAEARGDGGAALHQLLMQKRVVVCVGTGGVGKTTTAAALAVAGAHSGKKTLCLTIDPARRLAQGLGIDTHDGAEVRVPLEDCSGTGELTVMMLDGGLTFDELIGKYASSRQLADAVRGHKIYRYLSRHLAGTQSYMAMEKVFAVASEGRYDLIILDTPPSERALDFFDAPERLREILDSPLTQILAKAVQATETLRLGWLSKGIQTVVDAIGKITGSGLLAELGSLLATMNSLFGGFSERAGKIERRLRSPDFGYVLVTAPEAPRVPETLQLCAALGERGLWVDALVLNRFPEDVTVLPTREAVVASEALAALVAEATFPERLLLAGTEQATAHSIAADTLTELRRGVLRNAVKPFFLRIAPADYELHEIAGIERLARGLFASDNER